MFRRIVTSIKKYLKLKKVLNIIYFKKNNKKIVLADSGYLHYEI